MTQYIRDTIQRIERLIENAAPVEAYRNEVAALFGSIYSDGSYLKGTGINDGSKLHRATKHHTSLPENARELTYPPTSCSRLGRCNRASGQMFYASVVSDCAAIEVAPVVDTLVVLAEWEVTSQLTLLDFGYAEAAFTAAGTKRPLDPAYRDHFAHLEASARLRYEYVSRVFTDPTDRSYAVRTAITEQFVNVDHPFSGVLYPSIAFQHDTDNIALKPSVADSHIRLVGAKALKVTRWVERQQFNATLVATVTDISSNGSLTWKPEPKVEEIHGLRFSWDGSEMWVFSAMEIGLAGQTFMVRPGHRIRPKEGTIVDAQGNPLAPVP